jgi:choline dehydrogenase
MDYDVIVIGSGAAGAALCHRLTAEPQTSVLLIEAGPDARPTTVSDPAAWPALRGSELDYLYETVPQAGTGGRRHIWARGRALGGSTIMNAMIYQRSRARDVEQWGPGWDPAELTRVYEAMEAPDGPVSILRGPPRDPNELCAAFIDASVQAGHQRFSKFNAPGAEGAGWYDLSIDAEGERADAAQDYLRPFRDRPNLHIWSDTTVKALRFRGRRVDALELVAAGEERELAVTGEVVLSAGTIDSAVLLLRSGVGPAAHLLECGIEVVLDLPVGRGLQEHPGVPVVWSTTVALEPPRNQFFESALLLEQDARIGGRTAHITFGHMPYLPPEANPPSDCGTAVAYLVDPHSSGSLSLNPEQPLGPPLLDPAYLSDDRDVTALMAAVNVVRGVADQEAFSRFELTELLPGPHVAGAAALEEFVRASAVPFNHAVSTCVLGDGPDSVVDRQLRVRGAENLRVADASVMPRIPTVPTSPLTQAIGWRAAELILAT